MSVKERILHAFGFHDKLQPTSETIARWSHFSGEYVTCARVHVCPTCGRKKAM